jgi:hypothetical protein
MGNGSIKEQSMKASERRLAMLKTIIVTLTHDGNLIYNDIPYALAQLGKQLKEPAYTGCDCTYQIQENEQGERVLFRKVCGNQACVKEATAL